MGNKPDLDRLKADHEADQESILQYWTALFDQDPRVDMKRTSALTLIASVQRWERFRSDWQIRAIARDSSTYAGKVRRQVDDAIPEPLRAGRDAGLLVVRASLPKHLGISDVEKFLDAEEKNVTYNARSSEERAATSQLAPPFRAKVMRRSDDDWLIVDLVRQFRHAIAHGSGYSIGRMNRAIAAMSSSSRLDDQALQKGARRVTESGIGSYLFAAMPGHGTARVVHLLTRIVDVANTL